MGTGKRRRDSLSPERSLPQTPETKKPRLLETIPSPGGKASLRSPSTLQQRKEYVLCDGLYPNELARIRKFIEQDERDAADGKDPDECWPHRLWVANPKHSDFSRKATSRAFGFIHRNGARLSVTFNHGTWVKILNYSMTEEERNGVIYGTPGETGSEVWDLSHLCGNWMCINPDHAVLEPRSLNLERKACHRTCSCESARNGGEPHSPACIVGVQIKDPSSRKPVRRRLDFSLGEESEVSRSSQESNE